MKILYVTTIGGTMNFFAAIIKQLIDEGHTVDIATNENSSKVPECYKGWGCMLYQIDTSRAPLNKGNKKAIKQLKTLVEKEGYDIVHCHTPIAAMCARLSCRKARKNGTKVIYTAHGFHFFKGAPLLNWLIYYPIEKFCARWTDILITINKEDYALAQKKMPAKCVEYVPGVGIDLEKFKAGLLSPEERTSIRASLGVSEDDKLLLSVGELNDNKNHAVILRALQKLPENIKYCIAGEGTNREKLLSLAKELGIEDRFRLLGRRNDISELLNCADVFCFPSFREGLPVSLMEAMACGLPVVCSGIRGNVDLIEDGKGGYLCKPTDVDAFAENIRMIIDTELKQKNMAGINEEKIKDFSSDEIKTIMHAIYSV